MPAIRLLNASSALCALLTTTALLASGAVHAQWVPPSGHVWRQAQANVNHLATATVHLHAHKSQAATLGTAAPVAGQGLSLGRWAGRAGVALHRDVNPVKDSYVLAQPAQHGLKLRSLHILSDLELGSGFRASAGLVKGDITQAWWGDGNTDGGLQLSVQQLDRLGLLGARSPDVENLRPYLGAGYSTGPEPGAHSAFHFSADLGVTPRSSSQRSNGEGLQLNPVLKLSMRYSF